MDKSLPLLLGMSLGLVLWNSAVPTSADQTQRNEINASHERGKEVASSPVVLIGQAAELVEYARDNESALAMLAAVQMLRRVKVREDNERFGNMESRGGPPSEVESEARSETSLFDTKALLSEAKPWARHDKHLSALIKAEMKRPPPTPGGTLGPTAGPSYGVQNIWPGEIHRFTITYRRGALAAVVVRANGPSALDLAVYDEDGNLVDRDGHRTNCMATWNPKRTGPFVLEVKNVGGEPNTYEIVTM